LDHEIAGAMRCGHHLHGKACFRRQCVSV
jgi:hypothetical protein